LSRILPTGSPLASIHPLEAKPLWQSLHQNPTPACAQILDYERVNNLAPNPGRKYCWDNTERAVAAIAKAEGK
jgi:hypothetical protein